jgi:hypothetical protein
MFFAELKKNVIFLIIAFEGIFYEMCIVLKEVELVLAKVDIADVLIFEPLLAKISQ